MSRIDLPYGHEFISVDLPDNRLKSCLRSNLHDYKAACSQTELVSYALQHPIGTPRLCDMARGKNKIVIISSDHTRPVPSKIIMPLLLDEIRSGNPDADITILIATGCHRCTSRDELADKFGPTIFNKERIIVHDCDDESMLVDLGPLPSGGELIINRLAVEADLLIAEGFIEPHFFAGFSGGRKSVLPGIASRQTVLYNHNAAFINDPNSRTGILKDNPIHRDMLYASRAAHLAFICNVVINAEKEAVFAVAGDVDLAHQKGCEFLLARCQVKAEPSPIVITTNGGYPLDQNIYQAVKGMTAAEAAVIDGGVTIMLARSNDGHGGQSFYETFANEPDLHRMMQRFLNTPATETIIDQWQSQIFARLLMRSTVIYISEAPDDMVRNLHMLPAHSLADAIAMADHILAENSINDNGITVIPDGVSVIVTS